MSCSCTRPPESGPCAGGDSPRSAGAHATDAPHAEPPRPRTTHRPTPRRGRRRPDPEIRVAGTVAARGRTGNLTALNLHLLCLLRRRRLRRAPRRRRRKRTKQVPCPRPFVVYSRKQMGIFCRVISVLLHACTVIARTNESKQPPHGRDLNHSLANGRQSIPSARLPADDNAPGPSAERGWQSCGRAGATLRRARSSTAMTPSRPLRPTTRALSWSAPASCQALLFLISR